MMLSQYLPWTFHFLCDENIYIADKKTKSNVDFPLPPLCQNKSKEIIKENSLDFSKYEKRATEITVILLS